MNDPASLQSILFWVARRAGLAPSGDNANLDPDKGREILTFVDDRLREGWDLYDFLETTPVEERVFRDPWDPTIVYPAGAVVWDPCSRQYFESLVTTTGSGLNNPTIWKATTGVTPRYIPWQQNGKNPIGACLGAWTANPYEDRSRRRMYYLISQRGLEFTLLPNAASVWLVYRIPYPGIGTDEWDAGLTYSKGDQVFSAPDSFVSLVDQNIGHDPATSPDQWSMFRIPYPFVRFVRQAAYADSLVVNGQNDKAQGELATAYGYLGQAFDDQTIRQGQRENWQGYVR
jgi:hypothetical protein